MSQYQSNYKQLTFEIYIDFIRLCFSDNTMKFLMPSPIMYRNIFYEWIININDKNKFIEDDTLHFSDNFCNNCMTCYFEPYTDRFGIRVFKIPFNVKYITADVTFKLKDDINGNCIDSFNYKSKVIIFGCHLHWQYFDINKYLEFIKHKLVFEVYIKIENVFIDDNRQLHESNWGKYGIIMDGMVSNYLNKSDNGKDNVLGNNITLVGLEIDEKWTENEGIMEVKHETLMGYIHGNDDEVNNMLSGNVITLMGDT
eukprot:86271_1